MAGIFEQAGYDAMASISRVTPPEKPAVKYEDEMNRTNYMIKDRYDGRADIADVVGKQAEKLPADLYQNPVRAMTEKDPNKDVYASLLNYEFLS